MTDPTTPPATNAQRARGAGGTPGGFGWFFIGLAMVVGGAWLVLNHIQVTTSFGAMWGMPFQRGSGGGFGSLLIAMMFGIGFLFFNGKSYLGWLLTAGSMIAMIVSVVMNLRLWFPPTSLLTTLMMFGLIAAGLGLIVRSLKAFPELDEAK